MEDEEEIDSDKGNPPEFAVFERDGKRRVQCDGYDDPGTFAEPASVGKK